MKIYKKILLTLTMLTLANTAMAQQQQTHPCLAGFDPQALNRIKVMAQDIDNRIGIVCDMGLPARAVLLLNDFYRRVNETEDMKVLIRQCGNQPLRLIQDDPATQRVVSLAGAYEATICDEHKR